MPGTADRGVLACTARPACPDHDGDLSPGRSHAARSGPSGRCPTACVSLVRQVLVAINHTIDREGAAVPFKGGCLCGGVRYEVCAQPITTRVCWCQLCQKIGAGSATVNVCFSSAAVRIEGELCDYVCVADSGNVMHRRFCPTCGVHLFS